MRQFTQLKIYKFCKHKLLQNFATISNKNGQINLFKMAQIKVISWFSKIAQNYFTKSTDFSSTNGL